MAFEKFDKQPARFDRPVVTIQPANGTFVFNKSATELLPASTHFRYLVDEENEILAVEPTEEDNPHGYSLTRSEYTAQLSASAVMLEFGHQISQWDGNKHCPVERDDDRLIMDLGELKQPEIKGRQDND